MIKIKVKKDEEIIREISINGHALYDDYGKDIVCASVSSIVITTVNAILRVVVVLFLMMRLLLLLGLLRIAILLIYFLIIWYLCLRNLKEIIQRMLDFYRRNIYVKIKYPIICS